MTTPISSIPFFGDLPTLKNSSKRRNSKKRKTEKFINYIPINGVNLSHDFNAEANGDTTPIKKQRPFITDLYTTPGELTTYSTPDKSTSPSTPDTEHTIVDNSAEFKKRPYIWDWRDSFHKTNDHFEFIDDGAETEVDEF